MRKHLDILFSYRGRIGRLPFWFANFLSMMVCATGIKFGLDYAALPIQPSRVALFGSGVFLAWITTAGLTKRLHDRNRSGWFQFVFILPAFGYVLLSQALPPHPGIIAFGIAVALLGLWLFIEIGVLRGTLGANQFGGDQTLLEAPLDRWEPRAPQLPKNLSTPSDGEIITRSDVIDSWLTLDTPIATGKTDTSEVMPEILISTASTFAGRQNDTPVAAPTPATPLKRLTEAANKQAGDVATLADIAAPTATQKSARETDRFLEILKERATTNPAHALYLQRGAMAGNSWAKLEIAATWLSEENVTRDRADLSMEYFRDLADSSQTYLGAEREAAYFLGEIYRVGMRFTQPNEDLSFKYYVRAASLDHEAAQRGLAAQIARALHQGNDGSIVQPLVDAALNDNESADTLLKLISFDWSITDAESIPLILKTLVDQGSGTAAGFLGRMLLAKNDLSGAIKNLERADQLDAPTIDQITEIIQAGTAKDSSINALVDILQKHADLDNAYAQYHIARAYATGQGKPQDNIMAFVHISLASARIHGQERDALIKLRDEIQRGLTEQDIATAQEMIRARMNH